MWAKWQEYSFVEDHTILRRIMSTDMFVIKVGIKLYHSGVTGPSLCVWQVGLQFQVV